MPFTVSDLSASPPIEPIAIIGIGCRFPGGVSDAATFWQFLKDKRDAIGPIPASRFNVETYYDRRPATPGKIMTRWGGFLEAIDRFDAAFFNLSPREAERLDPQQRLLLETGWEALEDAGLVPFSAATTETGIFVGMWINDYEARLFADPAQVDFYMTTGTGRYAASGRLSYAFGFQGPSLTVDTACSSSLVALHYACQSLRQHECQVALAGAANVILQPHITIAYSQSQMMAPDGRCKFGDHRADGYVRSEGAAMLTLKRLSDAVRDGDSIYALLLGSAVNNDGRTSGFMTTPGGAGQEDMLRKAYRAAGVAPGHVQYVEAHGTGTRAGDPVEIGALGAVLAEGRAAESVCYLGSVKTNFGHTEGAAGFAGAIKVALSLWHGELPASLHLEKPNPNIPWERLPVRLQAEHTAWPAHTGPRLAGVSAFGIAGTNAHVVLQEAPPTAPRQTEPTHTSHLVSLSAHSPEALRALAERHSAFAAQTPSALEDIAYTTGARRAHHEHRLAVVARERAELASALAAFARDEAHPQVFSAQATEARPVIFVFPGQGSQWLGMGRQLLRESAVFREAMQACDRAIRAHTDWSLLEQLEADEAHTRLNEIDVIQPALFAMEVALAAVWRAWGITPTAVVGHSMGEVAAAHVAGALNLDEATHIICRRSQLMKRVSGQGAMALVELSLTEARTALTGYENRLSIAVSNGPRSTVLSGDPAALAEVTAQLQQRNVFVRPVKVDVAAHSPHMESLKPELVRALADLQPRATTLPIYSTVTGAAIEGADLTAEYWGRNLREPVLFAAVIEKLTADGAPIFVEMSPHPVLLAAIEQAHPNAAIVPSLRRGEDEYATLLAGVGQLYTLGRAPDWGRLFPHGGECLRLPAYPWQRERYWIDESASGAGRAQPLERLLGARLESSAQSGASLWPAMLNLTAFPYLSDHRVYGTPVAPAAAYVEAMLEAARDLFGATAVRLERLTFSEAMPLAAEPAPLVQITASADNTLRMMSRTPEATAWLEHARAALQRAGPPPAPTTPAAIAARCGAPETAETHYAAMAQRGLPYGQNFQGVISFQRNGYEVLGQIQLPAGLPNGDSVFHPSLLDAAFQLLVAALPEAHAPGDAYLPVKLERLQCFASPRADQKLWAHIHRVEIEAETLRGDIAVVDDDGRVLLEASGLQLQRFQSAGRAEMREALYEALWREKSRAATAHRPLAGRWLLCADEGGVAQALAAQLTARGATPVLVSRSDDFESALKAANAWQGLVFLWSLDGAETPLAAEEHSLALMGVIQSLARSGLTSLPRLWLVTRGAHTPLAENTTASPAQAALWGLGASLAHEMPELHCTRIDLSPTATPTEMTALCEELRAEGDDQIVLRDERRWVAQLSPLTRIEPPPPAPRPANGQPFRVTTTRPGVLENLVVRACPRVPPAPGQVEIDVRATGLNFMNVMSALGVLPGYTDGLGPLGIECAGVITALGADVTGVRVGDEVLAIAFHSLSTHALADARLVLPKPRALSFEQAATLPIAFVTAYYALCELGHLRAGERVLIHAGAGGVGLAAIQIAQHLGAEIFATVGSAEKRAHLQALGVQHIFDSRALDFADEVLAATQGQGVDVVLNSLAGEAIAKSLECLGPYGRFIEIGKRDIYANTPVGLWPFQKNLSYFAVDLDRMARERPEQVQALFRAVMVLVDGGALQALPLTAFPVAQVADAFRFMAQAKHIGKVVVSLADKNVAVLPSEVETARIKPEATYLITGGLGALGLAVAQWLAQNGARHLALVGRSGATHLSASAQAALQAIEQTGARVAIFAADVSNAEAMAAVLTRIEQTQPPLRGVIHAAGVLDDGILLQQTPERFHAAFAPKAAGAWHLHQLTQDIPLDFFALFSSVTAPLGSPGQSNYAAANAYLDALAHYRRARGLPALSINWGPWADIGLAAQRAEGGRQGLRGLGALRPAEGLALFGQLLMSDKTQVLAAPLNAEEWCAAHPAAQASVFFAKLLAETAQPASAQPSGGFLETLRAAETARARRALLEAHVQEQVAHVLRLPPTRVDLRKPLRTLGIDSLMTIELRNRLEKNLGLTLSATLVWNYPTVTELAAHLADKLGLTAEAEHVPAPTASAMDDLSSADVEALLAEELNAVDDLLKGL